MSRGGIMVTRLMMIGGALLGCATPNHVTYAAINAPPRQFIRRSPDTVDVFVGKPPARPYVEVGLFEVYQGRNDDGVGQSTEAMLGSLRAHGALRGCDAVQVLGVELAGRESRRVVRGVCEMYTDEQALKDAGQRPAPPPLPGEGTSCSTVSTSGADPTVVPAFCPDPLVCSKDACVSPYR